MTDHPDKVLIVDFGAQYTQLIARRVREAGVYSEIVPFDKAEAALKPVLPKAIILSGGPASVHETGTPQLPPSGRQLRRAHPRHLLWRAGHGGSSRRPGGRRAYPRIRPRRAPDYRRYAAIPRRLALRRPAAGVDEPWRSRHQAPGRLPRRRGVQRRAVRGHRRRCPQALWRAVPSRGGAHA